MLTLYLITQVFTPFSINWILYIIIEACLATVRELTALTLFHFFAKRAKKLIVKEQQKQLMALERLIVGISLFFFLVLLGLLGFKIWTVQKLEAGSDEQQDAKYLCHSPATVFSDLTCIVLTIAMACLTRRIQIISSGFDEQLLQSIEASGRSAESSIAIQAQELIKVRKQTVGRIKLVMDVLVAEAVLLFLYGSYKYLFYSADCNPRNGMSLEANEFLNMIGAGCAYLFWLMFVLCFFWPTKAGENDERSYRKARKRLHDTESLTRSSGI